MRPTAALLACMFPAICAAADWPTFRGNPAQDGLSPESLPDKLEIVWQHKTGDAVENGAAVVNGVVYAGSFDEHLYALDLANGAEKWKVKLGPLKAVPGVNSGVVYAGDVEGNMHAVEAATGKILWKFTTEGTGEITSGCNFAGDRVLFGSHDQTLYCLDKAGKLAWKAATDGPIYGAPAVAADRAYFAGCDSRLRVCELAGGKESEPIDLGGQTGASAAAVGDRVFVGTMSNQVLAVNPSKPEVAWRFEPVKKQPFYSSPAVTDKLVIIGGRDRRVVALSRTEGKEVWAHVTGNRVDASPVVAGGRVYVGSLDGFLYALNLDDGKEVQKIKLDGPVSASAAVSGGRLVVATQAGTVYCLGRK